MPCHATMRHCLSTWRLVRQLRYGSFHVPFRASPSGWPSGSCCRVNSPIGPAPAACDAQGIYPLLESVASVLASATSHHGMPARRAPALPPCFSQSGHSHFVIWALALTQPSVPLASRMVEKLGCGREAGGRRPLGSRGSGWPPTPPPGRPSPVVPWRRRSGTAPLPSASYRRS